MSKELKEVLLALSEKIKDLRLEICDELKWDGEEGSVSYDERGVAQRIISEHNEIEEKIQTLK